MYRSNPDENSEPNDFNLEGPGLQNTKNWALYLKMADLDLVQFLSLYPKLSGTKDALLKVAHCMKNTKLDWTVVAQNPDGLSQDNLQELNQAVEAIMRTVCQKEKAAYTVHRNLGFVMMKGLLACLTNMWGVLVGELGVMLSAQALWQHTQLMRSIETTMILAFASQEVGELSICVHHCKHTLSLINELLKCVQNMPGGIILKQIEIFKQEAHKILFDLRELCLQTIDACQDEQGEEDFEEDELSD